MERVLEGVGPAEEVGDQVEDHSLEEVDLEAGVPVVAGQTAQGREQVEEAYHHDLEAQPWEVEDPGLEVEVLEVLGDLVDRVGGVEDPACHLEKEQINKKDKNKKKNMKEVSSSKPKLLSRMTQTELSTSFYKNK